MKKPFGKIWKLEKHLRTHAETTKFKCNDCGKEFLMEWRLKKHKEMHTKQNVKKCHYYNNSKICPFDDIGCKFVHEVSKKCFFPKSCKTQLSMPISA